MVHHWPTDHPRSAVGGGYTVAVLMVGAGARPAGWSPGRVRRAMLPWDHPDFSGDGEAGFLRHWLLDLHRSQQPPDDLWPEGPDQDWQTADVFGEVLVSLWRDAVAWCRVRLGSSRRSR